VHKGEVGEYAVALQVGDVAHQDLPHSNHSESAAIGNLSLWCAEDETHALMAHNEQ
jgi:hypothetical protein